MTSLQYHILPKQNSSKEIPKVNISIGPFRPCKVTKLKLKKKKQSKKISKEKMTF
jgi:hypothetical protein